MQLETAFTTTQPEGKPSRGESLFLFESFDGAEWHWAKMRDGIFYECEIPDDAVLHRGDMRYVDLVGEDIRAGRDPLPHTRRYWAGDSTDSPRWELLASNAVVTNLISDDQQLRIARARHGQRLARGGAVN